MASLFFGIVAAVDFDIQYSSVRLMILASFSYLSIIFFRLMVVTTFFLLGLFSTLISLSGAIFKCLNEKSQNVGEHCHNCGGVTEGGWEGAFVFEYQIFFWSTKSNFCI